MCAFNNISFRKHLQSGYSKHVKKKSAMKTPPLYFVLPYNCSKSIIDKLTKVFPAIKPSELSVTSQNWKITLKFGKGES